MMRKITITLEENLIEALSRTAAETGLKKTQIIRNALKNHLKVMQKESAEKRWLQQNAPSIEAYNRHIEKDGLFAESFRTF